MSLKKLIVAILAYDVFAFIVLLCIPTILFPLLLLIWLLSPASPVNSPSDELLVLFAIVVGINTVPYMVPLLIGGAVIVVLGTITLLAMHQRSLLACTLCGIIGGVTTWIALPYVMNAYNHNPNLWDSLQFEAFPSWLVPIGVVIVALCSIIPWKILNAEDI